MLFAAVEARLFWETKGEQLKRPIFASLVATSARLVSYLGGRALASWRHGYSWQEMDWHQQGSTSISDFLAASDIGKRTLTGRDRKPCTEYYAYKDGLPVKVVCPPSLLFKPTDYTGQLAYMGPLRRRGQGSGRTPDVCTRGTAQ